MVKAHLSIGADGGFYHNRPRDPEADARGPSSIRWAWFSIRQILGRHPSTKLSRLITGLSLQKRLMPDESRAFHNKQTKNRASVTLLRFVPLVQGNRTEDHAITRK